LAYQRVEPAGSTILGVVVGATQSARIASGFGATVCVLDTNLDL
jgi:alanine dehydrogenase